METIGEMSHPGLGQDQMCECAQAQRVAVAVGAKTVDEVATSIDGQSAVCVWQESRHAKPGIREVEVAVCILTKS